MLVVEMAVPKEIWGVRISPVFLDIASTNTPPDEEVEFTLTIDTFQKGDNRAKEQFITNPAIRRIIREQGFPRFASLGSIRVVIDHAHRTMSTARGYYPLSGDMRSRFTKKGVANFAEYRIERFLQNRFPSYAIQSAPTPLRGRRRQLESRGRALGEPVPIARAARLTRKQVAEGIRHAHGLTRRNAFARLARRIRYAPKRLKTSRVIRRHKGLKK